MKRLIAFFVDRGLLVNMLSLMLLAGGIFAALSIQREAFPSINFDVVLIDAVWPGASPREIERLVVTPIERAIKGIDGIITIHSTSNPGSMSITIKVDPDYADRSRFVSDVQQALNRVDLPNDLLDDPLVSEIKSDQAPAISFTVFGDMEPLLLKRIADQIEDDVLSLPGVARIMTGNLKEEIRIVLDPDRMHRQRISTNDVVRLIQGWNVNVPGGLIKEANSQKVIRVAGQFTSAVDAGRLVLRANERGDALLLSDIATVTEALEMPHSYIDAMGKQAVTMRVLKRNKADVIGLVDRIRAYLDTVPSKYGKDVHIRTYSDYSTMTRLRLGVLSNNGAIGLVLVLLILLLFLRPAVAFTTAWGLPIIFFSGFLVLYIAGTTLNLLTMFGFIIVIGLMVDDAIIIGENTTWHMEQGMPPNRAAIMGTYELAGPISTTVLTTIAAFLPLMFMQGIIGKFVASIPIVVIILLLFSWLESIFILPNHIRAVSRASAHPKERLLARWLTWIYTPILRLAVKFRYLTVIATLMALGGSLWLASDMKFQLFPSGAEHSFQLRITAPPGTTLDAMHKKMLAIDSSVRAQIDPSMLQTTIVVTGINSIDARDSFKQLGDRYGYVYVVLTPFSVRNVSASTIMHKFENRIPTLFPEVSIRFELLKDGPPVGRALHVELSGSDDVARTQTAKNLATYLAKIDGVHSIETGLSPGDPEIHIKLNRQLAAYAGVNLATVATHIKAAFDGLRVSTLNHGKEEVNVTIRYAERFHNSVATLSELDIPNRMGGLTKLGKIAAFETKEGISRINHIDGNSVINIFAEVDAGRITSRELNAQVLQDKEKWIGQDINKVNVHMGGEEERSQESLSGLLFSFVYALAGIFAILAIQFNRVSYPLLVMSAIPFGAVGIIGGFFLHGLPLSFMALMGLVALTGVVVNDSLIISVFIQRSIEKGVAWRLAVHEAGKRRLRAVVLTTITTVIGLLPTAYGWGGFDPFVAPMALALSWGLLFSTGITLLFIPAVFGIGMDIKQVVSWSLQHLPGKRNDRV